MCASLTGWKNTKRRSFRASVRCLQMWLASEVSELNELPSEGQLHYLRWLEGRKQRWKTFSSFALLSQMAYICADITPSTEDYKFSLFNVELYCSPAWVFSGLGLHWGCNIVILLYWGFSFLVFGFLPYLLIMGPLDIWEHRAHLIMHFKICTCIIHLDNLNNAKSNNKKKVYNAQNKYLLRLGL